MGVLVDHEDPWLAVYFDGGGNTVIQWEVIMFWDDLGLPVASSRTYHFNVCVGNRFDVCLELDRLLDHSDAPMENTKAGIHILVCLGFDCHADNLTLECAVRCWFK